MFRSIGVGGIFAILCVTASGSSIAGSTQAGESTPTTTNSMAEAPDYAKAESWACRVGKEKLCTEDLDTLVYLPNGEKHVEHFVAADHPAIDCFYVYPTVSREGGQYADMQETAQVQRVVHVQAGRLSSVCRVFAPIYRQSTLRRLQQRLAGEQISVEDFPKRDIQAAWDYYLSHYNQGRGVVLVGHSQGTGMLQRLISERIDGQKAQSLLVAAFLAGDGSLAVPPGTKVGGTFKHIAVCSFAAQTGCVYPWGTYADGDPIQTQNFGRPRTDGLKSECVNPAAPSGGVGKTKFILPKAADAPASDPPFVEYADQVTGGCKELPAGNGFRVSVPPGPHAKEIDALMLRAQKRQGWGLHGLDIFLVQGNMLSVIAAESNAWQKDHRR